MSPSPHGAPRAVRHPLLARLVASLEARPGAPAEDDGQPARAAVAIVFRLDARSDLEILLIRRAQRDGDPWSGQIALPGGRMSAGDATLQDTAIRETIEETGIDLARDGTVLGALDELRPRTPVLPPIIVTPFAALLHDDRAMTASDEVAEAFWVPWSEIGSGASARESMVSVRGAEWRVPSYVLGERVVWGMTERILNGLASRLTSGE